MISIIITYHNEGQGFMEECIKQLKETVDIDHEVIIVDDCSETPLAPIRGTRILRHEENKGVGAGFDTGVSYAKFDNVIIMGCDIRFFNNRWASRMHKEIEANPFSLICTTCVGINKYYGATLLLFHDRSNNRLKPDNFRGIFDAKWITDKPKGTAEVPCILGAFYGVKKSWYNYVDGFWGHRQWGCLEPLISMKSWLFGGNCLCVSDIETKHIFRRKSTHGIRQANILFNKMLTARLLFNDWERYIDFLGHNQDVDIAKGMLESLNTGRKMGEYMRKRARKVSHYTNRFNLDERCQKIER